MLAAVVRKLSETGLFGTSQSRVCEPEPVYGGERPMTGFLATLTSEQREAALAYRGPDNHGDK